MAWARRFLHAAILAAAWSVPAFSLLAAPAPADGLDALGNTDGVLTWRLGRLDPGASVTEWVLFACSGTHEELVRILESARAHLPDRRDSPDVPIREDVPAVAWIRNEATNLALHPDGSFFWEGVGQALESDRGGQLSRFSYRVRYDDGTPRDAGARVTRKDALDNLRILEPVQKIDAAVEPQFGQQPRQLAPDLRIGAGAF